MITAHDIQMEKLLREASAAPRYKGATHTVRFDRDIFYYNKDEVERQKVLADRIADAKVTYEDHIKAVNTARFMLGKDTAAEIAMAILTHRWFKDYRARAFKGSGSFREDFGFVVSRVGNIVNHRTGAVIKPDIKKRLEEYTEPTLVQINHLANSIEIIQVPGTLPLQEWASKLNKEASETTTYVVAGRRL